MKPPVTAPSSHSGVTKWAASDLSDTEIIAQVLAGNDAAYEGIMRRYNRMLFRLARGIVRRDDVARDIVQDSYVRAYYRLSQFNGPKGFPSWIGRIVINEALTLTRKTELLEDRSIDTDQLPIDSNERPEQLAMRDDIMQLIETAVDGLPQDFRIVFMLRGVEQLTIKETAELIEIKPETVKTRFHRARLMVRKALEQTLGDTVPESFPFGGKHCDEIVSTVFKRIFGGTDNEH